MSILVGSTGFVGGHLQKGHSFEHQFNRSNIAKIENLETDLLVCAGLPSEKWKANKDPSSDWNNVLQLSQMLTKVKAENAILISSIDVYQPAINVTERDSPNYNGKEAYGSNRAWFEVFFKSIFSNAIVIRLPGLFGNDLRKNLIFDLINGRNDQVSNISGLSFFQYFNISGIWDIIDVCRRNNLSLLNLATEPVSAQEIADIFKIKLNNTAGVVTYDMRSLNDSVFGGVNGYLQSKEHILHEIEKLKRLS